MKTKYKIIQAFVHIPADDDKIHLLEALILGALKDSANYYKGVVTFDEENADKAGNEIVYTKTEFESLPII